MRKTIPLEQLTVGMSVVGMDQSWLKTPFLRHHMRITRPDQIEKLKRAGVRFVDVEAEELPPRCAEGTPSGAPGAALIQAAQEAEDAAADRHAAEPEELEAARQVYDRAKEVVQQAMSDARTGRAINTDEVSRVVTGLVDNILQSPDALVSLSRLKSFDEYTFFHSVNTSVLALALGRKIGMGRDGLERLGAGALLHDIGKTKIPVELLNKPGRYETWEFEIVKQHALRGVEILSRVPEYQDEVIRPALEHHERVDGTGYPFGRSKAELTQFGLIASVVDIYDAMTSDRCYHRAMPAHRALQFLYDLGQRGHLDSLLVQRFIQCVGVYPVGSCVLLDTGEIGIVARVHHERPVEPELIIVRDPSLERTPPTRVNLSEQTRKPIRTILGVVNAEEHRIDVSAYLDTDSNV
ncbi:HD-GYP domain-containing protein [Candidatus Nitrospira bockiana]